MYKSLNTLVLAVFFISDLSLSLHVRGENNFTNIAYAYLHGSLSLINDIPNPVDFAFFNGKYYWPHGPLPAVIILPFVWIFGTNFQESIIKFIFTICNFLLVYKIATRLKTSPKISYLIALFFIFGSIYTPLAVFPYSTYFLQIVMTTLILFAIYEFLTNKRYLLIGIIIALATLTRITAVLSLAFFVLHMIKKPNMFPNLSKLIMPAIISLFIIGFYNFQSFGSFMETGHKYRFGSEDFTLRKKAGLFSLEYIPTNLYYLLIKTPDPVFHDQSNVLRFPFIKSDPYGMSLFFISPLLFLLFRANFRNPLNQVSIFTIGVMLLPLITYAGIGYKQIGYRYALDFFPFILIILISVVKKIKLTAVIALIILSILITWFFIIEKYSALVSL